MSDVDDIVAVLDAKPMGSGSILSKIKYQVGTGSRALDDLIKAVRTREDGSEQVIVLPYGRAIEITGIEHVGKTTLATMILAEAQKDGAICMLADVENTFDVEYAESLGVDTSQIIPIEAEFMEDLFLRLHDALDIIVERLPDRRIVIVWDSLGQTPTRAEVQVKIDPKTGQYKTPQVMSASKCVAENIRRMSPRLPKTQTLFVVLNQMYQKQVSFGDPWESYGGRRLKNWASIRLRLMPSEIIRESGKAIGRWIKADLVKTKLAPKSFASIKVPLLHGLGFSDAYQIYMDAKSRSSVLESLSIKGAGYGQWEQSTGDVVKFRGWSAFVEKVASHPLFHEVIDEYYDTPVKKAKKK